MVGQGELIQTNVGTDLPWFDKIPMQQTTEDTNLPEVNECKMQEAQKRDDDDDDDDDDFLLL